MTRSEFTERIVLKQSHLSYRGIEAAVKLLLEQMSEVLASGGRVEIRGFGSFSVRTRPQRNGRNPKTGEAVSVLAKPTPYIKSGKEMRERVNGFKNKR